MPTSPWTDAAPLRRTPCTATDFRLFAVILRRELRLTYDTCRSQYRARVFPHVADRAQHFYIRGVVVQWVAVPMVPVQAQRVPAPLAGKSDLHALRLLMSGVAVLWFG